MESISTEQASQSLNELIKKINQENKPYKITTGDEAVIVLGEEMYDNLLVTLEFLSTPGLLDRLKEQEEVHSS